MLLGLLLGEIPPNKHENIKGVVYVNSGLAKLVRNILFYFPFYVHVEP